MKKWIAIVVALLIIPLLPMKVQAADAGYYYESIDVQVEVNSAREFKITETLNVYYEDEMHGIIRSIPTISDVEGYMVSDIHVDGAPYVVEESDYSYDIRIGDADVYVKGLKQYTLRYTLSHYQDYDQNNDYIYLNLIGDDFDTHTSKLTAKIVWPENFETPKVTLTHGAYGAQENWNLKYTLIENGIEIQSSSRIWPFEAATVQLQFPQNTFVDAPEYHFPYTITNKVVDIEIDEQQDWHVKQSIDLDVHDSNVSYEIIPEFDAFHLEDMQIKKYKGMLDGKNVTIDNDIIEIETVGSHHLEISYILHSKEILYAYYFLSFINYYEPIRTNNMTINLSMPVRPDYNITFGRIDDIQEQERYSNYILDNTLTIKSITPVEPGERLIVSLWLNQEDYHRSPLISINIFPLLGGGIAILAFFIRLKNKQVMVSPIQFYPPKGMNSAEAGYLIDESISNTDMTSLIFYWAHLGYIKIHNIDENEFKLEKLKNISEEFPAYEKELFNSMFNYGNGKIVEEKQLMEKFHEDISIAESAILNKYNTDRPIYEDGLSSKKRFIQLAGILIMFLSILFAYRYEGIPIRIYSDDMTLLLAVVLVNVISTLLFFKVPFLNKIGTCATYLYLLMVVVSFNECVLPLLFIWLCNLISIFMIASLKRYSEYGLSIIGKLKGFKEFLLYAEKDQLEMLLEENPEYYYEILPYAQALNVTKAWQDKFKDIAMEPPRYYEKDYVDVSSFNREMNNLQQSLYNSMKAQTSDSGSTSTTTSSRSSRGRSYNGGGRGYGGKGRSGGGSGGGSSRGW